MFSPNNTKKYSIAVVPITWYKRSKKVLISLLIVIAVED